MAGGKGPLNSTFCSRSSEPYNKDLASERRQAERRRVLLAKSVAKTLQNLARSSNFGDVEAAVERFKEAGACPAEAKAAYAQLAQHCNELMEAARDELAAQMTASHPAELDEVMRRYYAYGAHVTTEMTAAKDRRTQLISEANVEMQEARAPRPAALARLFAVSPVLAPSVSRAGRTRTLSVSSL